MEIAVLGGAGGIGRAVIKDLLANSDVRVRIVDQRKQVARKLADSLGDRASVAVADASRPRTLLRALDGVQAAVNCVGPFYRFAVAVAKAILDVGICGIDICDDYTPVAGLLALDDLAKRRRVTYLTGMGWSPGITNLLAVKARNELETITQVHVRWVAGSGDYRGPAALKHLLFTSTGEVPTYRGGQWVRVPALSAPETVELPRPLGVCQVSHCGHPEPLTLPRFLDSLTDVTVKGGLVPRWNNRAVRVAVRAGLTRDDRSIDKTARSIYKMGRFFQLGGTNRSATMLETVGTLDGRWVRLQYAVVDHMARMTALPAAVAVLMVARGQISEQGVFAPEAVMDPKAFFTELAHRGITVSRRLISEDQVQP